MLQQSDVVTKRLFLEVKEFVSHHLPNLEERSVDIASSYVMSTWIIERFNQVDYLRILGTAPGLGMTRVLNVLGHISFRPYFATQTCSYEVILRALSEGCTLLLDDSLIKGRNMPGVMRIGAEKGNFIARMSSKKSLCSFSVYGPKILTATRRYGDPSLESRFITIELAKPVGMTDHPYAYGAVLGLCEALDEWKQTETVNYGHSRAFMAKFVKELARC